MTVKSITMISETNAYDSVDRYDEPPQGATYDLTRIYRVENTDGPDQFFKFTVQLDSYGNAGGNYSDVAASIPRKFVEVTPTSKEVTVFERVYN